MPDISREELILQIRAIWDELVILKVHPEYINFAKYSTEDLEKEFETYDDQLKARKRFLGVDSYGKSNGTAC